MAIDATHNILSVEQITLLTKTYETDILESASLVNDKVFEDLKIKVYRNLENANAVMIFNRKSGTTRRYRPGNLPNSKVGYLEERELKVTLSVDKFIENIQNFREKEPFQVPTLENAYEAEVTRYLEMQIAKSYSGNVRNCLFHGDVTKEDTSYELYDGYIAHINHEINLGRISVGNMNYVEVDPITGVDELADYEAFMNFCDAWDDKLKAEEEVLVYCSPITKRRIIRGYVKKYQGGVTIAEANKPGYRFVDMENVSLMAHPSVGKGDQLIATVPWNFEFGSDVDNPAHTNVSVMKNPDDQNELIFQIQTAQGVRIRQISSDKLCVSSGSNTPTESMGGEYRENSLLASVNIAEGGSVAVSPEKASYEQGDKVTMTATASEGYTFEKWSDNVTVNPRTIVHSGFPEVYQAVFTKNA